RSRRLDLFDHLRRLLFEARESFGIFAALGLIDVLRIGKSRANAFGVRHSIARRELAALQALRYLLERLYRLLTARRDRLQALRLAAASTAAGAKERRQKLNARRTDLSEKVPDSGQ